VRTPKCNLEK